MAVATSTTGYQLAIRMIDEMPTNIQHFLLALISSVCLNILDDKSTCHFLGMSKTEYCLPNRT